MPVNLETINSFYNINLKPYEVDDFLQSEIAKNPPGEIISFEDKAISMMGRQLYEAFYKGYTMKQWQTDPAKLPASLLTRLPFRKNYEESYYYSKYQGIPVNGYTAIFNQLLANPLITVKLNTDFFEIKPFVDPGATVIYSGPIDKYFDYSLGKLEWRSLRFEREVKNVADYQGTAVMNYAEETIPYTRIHEFKHLHPERKIEQDKTVIYREFSYKTGAVDEPFYPVPGENGKELVLKYRALAEENPKLIIAGRLGDYRYYDMHETIATALQLFENKITPNH
jgi:UDP-galactopyranose mutase